MVLYTTNMDLAISLVNNSNYNIVPNISSSTICIIAIVFNHQNTIIRSKRKTKKYENFYNKPS